MSLHVPNLDNRSYDGMLAEARKKILETGSGWSDLGPSDPGTVLLEAFTFLTDQLIYRLNRLPEKAYLEFLRLMGLKRQPPAAAGAKLVFSVETPLEKPIDIPRGTRATLKRAGGTGEPPVFATVKAGTLPAGARSVELQSYHVELASGELAGRGTGKPGLSVTAQRVPIVSPLGEGLDLVVGTEALESELGDRANALEYQGKAYRIWREVENFTDLASQDVPGRARDRRHPVARRLKPPPSGGSPPSLSGKNSLLPLRLHNEGVRSASFLLLE